MIEHLMIDHHLERKMRRGWTMIGVYITINYST